MASVLALHNTMIQDIDNLKGEKVPLPITSWPLTTTFVKIKDSMIVDPTFTEESIADARITISMDDKGDIRAMQKGLKGSLNYDDVVRALDTARELTFDVRARLQNNQ